MNRQEHIEWCKKRALECVDRDDLTGAFASMASDISKHSETVGHIGIMLGVGLMAMGNLNTKEEMRTFIEDFN